MSLADGLRRVARFNAIGQRKISIGHWLWLDRFGLVLIATNLLTSRLWYVGVLVPLRRATYVEMVRCGLRGCRRLRRRGLLRLDLCWCRWVERLVYGHLVFDVEALGTIELREFLCRRLKLDRVLELLPRTIVRRHHADVLVDARASGFIHVRWCV